MTTIHRYLLCLGSNFKAEYHLQWAEMQINTSFPQTRWGKPILTQPEGGIGDRPYLNRVAIIHSDFSSESLKAWCKQLEVSCGRTADSKSTGIIPLDIDLLSVDSTLLKPDDMQKDYVRKALESLR